MFSSLSSRRNPVERSPAHRPLRQPALAGGSGVEALEDRRLMSATVFAKHAGPVGDGAPAAVEVGRHAAPDATLKSHVQSLFKRQFGALAGHPARFHALMHEALGGDGYDAAGAEQYRRRSVAGDFSWLPAIRLTDGATLNGAAGAFGAKTGVVYLDRALAAGGARALASTYVEEVGHFLDARLNRADSVGDEGELFRRLLGGERLSAASEAAIRADNDHGVIHIGGKDVEAEFLFGIPLPSPGDVWDGLKGLGGAVLDAGKVAGAATLNGLKNAAAGVRDGFTGFVGGVLKGDLKGALGSLYNGFDKAVLQAPSGVVNGYLDSAQSFLNAPTYLLGPVGGPFRNEIARGIDVVRTAYNTNVESARDVFRGQAEGLVNFSAGLYSAVGKFAKGDVKGAGGDLVRSIAIYSARSAGSVADSVARQLQGAAAIAQVIAHLQAPSRKLTAEEVGIARSIYGSKVDVNVVRIVVGGPLNADIFGNIKPIAGAVSAAGNSVGLPSFSVKGESRARTIGNTIYMPGNYDGTKLGKGTALTDDGSTLAHEMGHVWQNQNGGGDYISSALYAQLAGDGYDFEKGLREGRSFAGLNPEQQAQYIEKRLAPILTAGTGDGRAKLVAGLSGSDLAYALDALKNVLAGTGTPGSVGEQVFGPGGRLEPGVGYGMQGDVTVVGDWNGDGRSDFGVFRRGTWFLDFNRGGGAAEQTVGFGNATDKPVVGDWNGDGRDEIGVFRSGTWFLDANLSGGVAETVVNFGNSTDVPVVGDWNGDKRDELGVFRNGTWFQDFNLTGGAGEKSFTLGATGDRPVVGDWNGDGRDDAGVFTGGGNWKLRTEQSVFGFNFRPVSTRAYGQLGDTPIVGDWDGNGRDELGVVRRAPGATNLTWFANSGRKPWVEAVV